MTPPKHRRILHRSDRMPAAIDYHCHCEPVRLSGVAIRIPKTFRFWMQFRQNRNFLENGLPRPFGPRNDTIIVPRLRISLPLCNRYLVGGVMTPPYEVTLNYNFPSYLFRSTLQATKPRSFFPSTVATK